MAARSRWSRMATRSASMRRPARSISTCPGMSSPRGVPPGSRGGTITSPARSGASRRMSALPMRGGRHRTPEPAPKPMYSRISRILPLPADGERVEKGKSTRRMDARGSSFLTACGPQLRDKPAEARNEIQAEKRERAEGRIECALPGVEAFSYACTIDRVQSPGRPVLTLRHPDGGSRQHARHYRRARRGGGGRRRKGRSDRARPDRIEVAIGGARYRLPATVRGAKPGR